MRHNTSKYHNLSKEKSGFTLLEIVVVILIIGLIMGAALGTFGGVKDTARITTTRAKIQSVSALISSYELLAGRVPTESQGLQALITKPSSSPEPRRWQQQIKNIPTDAWQNELVYKNPGTIDKGTYEIVSKGKDGELGTDDDISSQEEF